MVIKEQPIIQFIHQYDYDADNRIRLVHTSSDGYVWNKEADYDYYLHGPLSRTELGHYRVQGVDYHYTLQGWIKGVNMPYAGDPGADGLNGNKTGKDVFAYTLGYFSGDYLPITADWVQQPDNRDKPWNRAIETIQHNGLYNGNISWMETDLPTIGAQNNDRTKGLQTMLYRYDQLHRITRSRSLTSYQEGYGWQERGEQEAYDEDYTYDANGNIMTLKRNDELATLKDDFVYDYYAGTNKLKNVKTTQTQNYTYDAIGNLTSDADEGVTISWTPYGKVRNVQKGDSVTTSYRYDASGNRVEMKVVKTDTTFITRYLRDASGNVMSIYKDTTTSETPIYGSARLGQYKGRVVEGHRTLGHRTYELSNHLGNVLAVITDNIHMQPTGTHADSTVWATVLNTSDYYPFGLEMKGRSDTDTTASAYRYGFNGKEKDDMGSSVYDYGFRIYNPEIAKFLSVDPLTKSYPWYTPYQFAGNKPIKFIDLDGLEEYDATSDPDFLVRLTVTTFFDIKHSVYNLSLALVGSDTRARYVSDEKGNETFETEFYERENEYGIVGFGKGLGYAALDAATVAGSAKFDPTDIIVAKAAPKSQFTRALRGLVDEIPSISRKLDGKQPSGRSFDFTIEDGKIKFADKDRGAGIYDFVITEGGELKLGRGHYALSDEAAKVKGAGQVNINSDGKIDYIDDYSGHYQPNKEQLINQATILKKSGVTTANPDVVKTN